MSIGKIYNLIVLALLGASGAMSILLYTTWSHVREKNAEHHQDELRLLRRLNKLKADKEYNTEYYNRLIHDENFAEHVIREGLGVVGKDEIVFRFKDSTPLNLESPMTPPSAHNTDTKSTPQKDAKPQQPQKPKEVALPPSEHQQKSFLRKLFSKDENPPKPEKEIIPQIKIDLSENQKSENINQPKEKISTQAKSDKSFKIENINVGEQQPQQIQKKKSPKKRGKNSIRFRAN